MCVEKKLLKKNVFDHCFYGRLLCTNFGNFKELNINFHLEYNDFGYMQMFFLCLEREQYLLVYIYVRSRYSTRVGT